MKKTLLLKVALLAIVSLLVIAGCSQGNGPADLGPTALPAGWVKVNATFSRTLPDGWHPSISGGTLSVTVQEQSCTQGEFLMKIVKSSTFPHAAVSMKVFGQKPPAWDGASDIKEQEGASSKNFLGFQVLRNPYPNSGVQGFPIKVAERVEWLRLLMSVSPGMLSPPWDTVVIGVMDLHVGCNFTPTAG